MTSPPSAAGSTPSSPTRSTTSLPSPTSPSPSRSPTTPPTLSPPAPSASSRLFAPPPPPSASPTATTRLAPPRCSAPPHPPHPQFESSSFHPCSPYAVTKVAAHWYTINYREAYGLFACNGILFNHESPCRRENFITRKITRAIAGSALACRMSPTLSFLPEPVAVTASTRGLLCYHGHVSGQVLRLQPPPPGNFFAFDMDRLI